MSKIRKKKAALFALEIILLLLFIAALYVYGQVSDRMDKIEQPVLDEEKIVVNEQAPQMTGYDTYALFAVDSRKYNDALEGENSDTIIIASVNNDTKDVKLVSVYRDTLMNIGRGNYTKANASYAYGGPEQAISMLNTSLDLNITDYATVDFSAMTTIVDLLGGLDIPLSYAEIEHMNNYCEETSKETGKSYTPIEKPEPAPPLEEQEEILGTYHLNGVQVTSYCRIRSTSSLDMGRTERQRRVIQMLVSKAKTAGLATLFEIMDQVFPMVQTSVTKTEILQLIPNMLGYRMDDTTGFPFEYKFAKINDADFIVATSLSSNVKELHEFLYGKTDYEPSDDVESASSRVLWIADEAEYSGGYLSGNGGEKSIMWSFDDDNSYRYEPISSSYSAVEEETEDTTAEEEEVTNDGGTYSGDTDGSDTDDSDTEGSEEIYGADSDYEDGGDGDNGNNDGTGDNGDYDSPDPMSFDGFDYGVGNRVEYTGYQTNASGN